MDMKASLENYENYSIIGNGSVITFEQNPVKILIKSEATSNLVKSSKLELYFLFENDANSTETRARSQAKGVKFELTLVNYNNVLGTGTNRPLELGKIDGIPFYINFRVYAFDSNSDKLLFYTLYTRKNVIRVVKAPTLKIQKNDN